MKRLSSIVLSLILLMTFLITSIGLTPINVASIKLDSANITLRVGKTYTLKVTITPANATNIKLVFSSGNKNVATVDKYGKIKGITKGKTVITVSSSSNKKAVAKCNVLVIPMSSIVTAPGQFPVVKQKTTLKIFGGLPPQVANFETNEFTKWYEEKTNVHIQWIQAGPDDAQIKEKANLMLSSGDLPDVFLRAGFTNDQIALYGAQGTFIPLNSLIDDYAPIFKDVIYNKAPYVRQAITALDGNIYTLPNIIEHYHVTMPQKMWIYKPWLDKLGLKMPESTDDFYNVLKAFKTKDPNGNSKADEVPLAGCIGGWNNNIDGFLMEPFAYNADDRCVLNNGKIDYAPITTGWREGLRYIKKLYGEKLIAPESFTQNSSQLTQMGESTVPILGAAPGGWYGTFTTNMGPSGRFMEYTVVPPLKGPTGLRQTVRYNYGVTLILTVTNKCKYPEVVVRWADWMYDERNIATPIFGPEGIGWRKPKQGEMGFSGEPAFYATLDTYGQVANTGWYHAATIYQTWASIKGIVPSDPDITRDLNYRLWKATQLYEPYAKKEILPLGMFMNEEQAAKNSEITKALNDYLTSAIIKFVTGEWDLDSQWSNYVKELEKLGAKEYVKIKQDIYDKKKGLKK